MAEYIEREAFLDAIERGKKYQQDADDIAEMLQNFPAADVRTVVRGKWKYKEGGELCADGYYCTACGTGFHVHVPYFAEFNFCPNCGANMREPPKEET